MINTQYFSVSFDQNIHVYIYIETPLFFTMQLTIHIIHTCIFGIVKHSELNAIGLILKKKTHNLAV